MKDTQMAQDCLLDIFSVAHGFDNLKAGAIKFWIMFGANKQAANLSGSTARSPLINLNGAQQGPVHSILSPNQNFSQRG